MGEPAGHAVGQPWWRPPVELAIHILVGALIFAIIATPAVILDLLLKKWLPTLGVSDYILIGLIGVKWFLFGADIALFFLYIVNTSWLFFLNLRWK